MTVEMCETYSDNRGDLVVFLTNEWLNKNKIPLGQIYLIIFSESGSIRGNHYHEKSTECFCLVKGSVHIRLQDIHTNNIEDIYLTSGVDPFMVITVKPNVAHAIKNLQPDTVVVSFSSVEYNENDPDKFNFPLL